MPTDTLQREVHPVHDALGESASIVYGHFTVSLIRRKDHHAADGVINHHKGPVLGSWDLFDDMLEFHSTSERLHYRVARQEKLTKIRSMVEVRTGRDVDTCWVLWRPCDLRTNRFSWVLLSVSE